MYLFNKRTRNVIKVFWGIFASLVIISMVFTYSGFTTLSRTQTSEPLDISPEDLQVPATTTLDVSTLSTSSPELQPLFESIKRDLESSDDDTEAEQVATPEQPAPPPLQFGL